MTAKWDEKRSNWYCRAIEHSNYPQKAVNALAPLLKKCESVIDIGAGCGALSIPIAGKVKKVTAVEPSKWMYELLLKRSTQAGIKNITAYNTGWKGNKFERNLHHDLKPHDMVICANLPGHIVSSLSFLRYIRKISKKFIVYIQNAGKWNRFYYKELYPLLLKKKYSDTCNYIRTYNFLHKQGILANAEIFDYYLDQPFKDFEEALDFWKHKMEIRLSSEKEKLLTAFLSKKLIHSGQACLLASRRSGPDRQDCNLIAPFGLRKSALVWWKP